MRKFARALQIEIDRLKGIAAAAAKQAAALEAQLTGPTGPYWVGDAEGTTPELIAAIRAAISDRPRTHAELVALTGARSNRVAGALNKLKYRFRVEDAADTGPARWSLRLR